MYSSTGMLSRESMLREPCLMNKKKTKFQIPLLSVTYRTVPYYQPYRRF